MKATNTGPGRSAAFLLSGAILLVACTSNLFPVTEKQPAIKDTNSESKERETESDSKIGTGPGHRDTATATDTGPGHRDTATATDTGTGTGAGVPTDTESPHETDSEVDNRKIGEQCCPVEDWMMCKPEEGWHFNYDVRCKYPEQHCCQIDCALFGGRCVPKGTDTCYSQGEVINPEFIAICPQNQICCSTKEPRACTFPGFRGTPMRCLETDGLDVSSVLSRCTEAGGTPGRGCHGDDVCCYDYDPEKLDEIPDNHTK